VRQNRIFDSRLFHTIGYRPISCIAGRKMRRTAAPPPGRTA
jgi:hypothetical protein